MPAWDHSVFSKNRDRLLEGDIAAKFLAAVLAQPRVKRLLSTDHFSVDGTLIEAWASMKSLGAQAGNRPRSLRGSRLARFPPSRHARHRSLRFLVSERSLIPPQTSAPRRSSRRLGYPKITDPAEPPPRPERHVLNSIATIRIRLANVLARRLPRCPCCLRNL